MYDVTVSKQEYLSHYVNCFSIETEGYLINIDTGLLHGAGNDIKKMKEHKKKIVLSTHGHWDHIGGHEYLQKCGADLYGHKEDERFYRDHNWHWNLLFGQFMDDITIPQERWSVFHDEIGGEVILDQILSDNEELIFDNLNIQCLHTPGHSNGSLCFLDKQNGNLFVGDTLMGDGFFSSIPQYSDVAAYEKSMEYLQKIDSVKVFSNHCPEMSGKKLAELVQRSIDCVFRIEKIVKKYVQNLHRGGDRIQLGEVAKKVCYEEQKALGAGACVTALAHLKILQNKYENAAECVQHYM